jgi:hypothetical protein
MRRRRRIPPGPVPIAAIVVTGLLLGGLLVAGATGLLLHGNTVGLAIAAATPHPTLTPSPTPTPSASPVPPPTSITLAANHTNVPINTGVTLTAIANRPVDGTGYVIDIINTTSGKVQASCSTGATCTASVTENAPTTLTFVAQVELSLNTGVSASSSHVNVTWASASAPHVNLLITRNQNYSEQCSGASAPVYSFTLDNTGSNVAVGWQFSAAGNWAAASPASATIGAGQVQTVQTTPHVCPAINTSQKYQAVLNLSFPQGGYEGNLALSDTISGPGPRVNFIVTSNQHVTLACVLVSGNWVPPSYTITYDNTGSNVPVTWVFSSGSPSWANSSPKSATVQPGKTGSFQVNPTVACPTAPSGGTFNGTLNLSFPQGGYEPNIKLSAQFYIPGS